MQDAPNKQPESAERKQEAAPADPNAAKKEDTKKKFGDETLQLQQEPRGEIEGGVQYERNEIGNYSLSLPGATPRILLVGVSPRGDVPVSYEDLVKEAKMMIRERMRRLQQEPRGEIEGGVQYERNEIGNYSLSLPGATPRILLVGVSPRGDVPVSYEDLVKEAKMMIREKMRRNQDE